MEGMKKLDDLITVLEFFLGSIDSIIEGVIKDNEHKILEEVRAQLWDGLTGNLTQITPNYLNDPYFETRGQAIGYMEWKQKITPNSRRRKETPNLFINGYFHGTLTIDYLEGAFLITSHDPMGQDIMEKYGYKTFAVNDEFIKGLKEEVKTKIMERL